MKRHTLRALRDTITKRALKLIEKAEGMERKAFLVILVILMLGGVVCLLDPFIPFFDLTKYGFIKHYT